MIDFTVKPDNGEEYQVTAEARDVLLWERATKYASVSKLGENPSMTDLYGLAYHASRRQGLFTGNLEEFEKTCDLDFERGGDDEPDPTQPEA